MLRGGPDTQVWPGGADQQSPGETVPEGQQGLKWGDHHVWEKGEGIREGPRKGGITETRGGTG